MALNIKPLLPLDHPDVISNKENHVAPVRTLKGAAQTSDFKKQNEEKTETKTQTETEKTKRKGLKSFIASIKRKLNII